MDQAELINEFVILLLHSACINQARLPINALNTGSSKRKGAKFGEGSSVTALAALKVSGQEEGSKF